MSFQVVWSADARLQLAEIWMAASDRARVTAATYEIDRDLSTDPAVKGRPQGDLLRSLRRAPLQVLYEVLDDRGVVHVLDVVGDTAHLN